MNDRNNHTFNDRRRTFLRTLGIAAGAAAMRPAGFLFGKPQDGVAGPHSPITHMPKIGILVPEVGAGQYGGEHFVAGFKCRLEREYGARASVVVETCEKSPHAAMKQAAALASSGAAEVLVAPLNADMAARLHPVLEEHDTVLINIDAGANILRDGELHPNIINHSLSHWQSNFELGRRTVERCGRKVMIVSSLIESGYDALYAFRVGVEESGGTLTTTHVTHGLSTQEAIAAAIAEVRQAAPDAVCAMYSGMEAHAFLKAYAQSGLLRKIPLVASPFAVDAFAGSAFGPSIDGVLNCRSWSRSIATKVNTAFVQRYEAYAHHRADAFSVLGYDTAGMIAEAARATGGSAAGAAAFCQALAALRIESPRGTLALDPVTKTMTGPVYLCEARQHGTMQVVIETIDQVQAMSPELAALTGVMRSGFSHSYLTA